MNNSPNYHSRQTQLVIRKCSATEIIGHPHFPALRCEYVAEAAVADLPDPAEKLALYQNMDASGFFQIYGAFINRGNSEAKNESLVGFVAVLTPILPHYGATIAVTESLFVAKAQRKTGAGLKLIRAAERHAKDVGSPGLLISAPWQGRLATLLPRIGYSETNKVFMKRIHHE